MNLYYAFLIVLTTGVFFILLLVVKKKATKLNSTVTNIIVKESASVENMIDLELNAKTVKDIDGNVYNTVTIGTQVWMVENLKTTRYRNGDLIHNETDDATWKKLTSAGYCWYNNDETANKTTYGALYNWYAVSEIRNIAPLGWHVPTIDEWKILITFLGGNIIAGGKLKESGSSYWKKIDPDTCDGIGFSALSEKVGLGWTGDTTNSSGFTALPGGYRYNFGGKFSDIGESCFCWSTSESAEGNAVDIALVWDLAVVFSYSNIKQYGFSIRCVKDSETV